jgi:putative ABC transport system permease protein
MKYLPLIWKSLWRRKVRTIFTLAAIFIAFVLFGILMAIRTAFSFGIDVAGIDRLVLIHKVSLIMPLPVSYQARIASVEGVEAVTHNSWFGGIYQDPQNFFAQIALEPEPYFAIYPEFKVPPDQMKAFLADRQGAIVGRDLATRFNWKIGDRIPIQATIWQPKSGNGTWEFNLVGIYDGDRGVDKTNFFFRYDYLDENRNFGQGSVGWYIVKVADPARSSELAAKFDDMFANSDAETKTTTEKGFVDGFAKQIGNIGLIMMLIVAVVLFMLLLVVANIMSHAVRERTSELAVLKTLGFSNIAVLSLVLIEALCIAILGGALGLLVSWGVVQLMAPVVSAFMPAFFIPTSALAVGAVLMVVLGLASGAIPAVGAMRLKITDALRRN